MVFGFYQFSSSYPYLLLFYDLVIDCAFAGDVRVINNFLQPLIVSVAPNGARKSKTDHPSLPISDRELAETAASCRAAGAAMIHLHVRDSAGRHSLDPGLYRSAIAAIRREVGADLIVQVTSESVGMFNRDEQMSMVRDLRPEAVSLALGELVANDADELSAAEFFAWLLKESIAPQYILYSAQEVRRFHELRKRGIIPGERPFVLFVLGRYDSSGQADPYELLPFLAAHDSECPWAACAFGRMESACAIAAIGLQGHVRVGFENNLHLSDGRVAPDNAALVAQAVAASDLSGRIVADADSTRRLLGCS